MVFILMLKLIVRSLSTFQITIAKYTLLTVSIYFILDIYIQIKQKKSKTLLSQICKVYIVCRYNIRYNNYSYAIRLFICSYILHILILLYSNVKIITAIISVIVTQSDIHYSYILQSEPLVISSVSSTQIRKTRLNIIKLIKSINYRSLYQSNILMIS